jgi:GntR family transcriptional regulator
MKAPNKYMDENFDFLSTPKYQTIAQDLQKKIQQEFYVSGQFLPSENELAQIYQASRPTVRAAIAKLRERGILEVIHGVGTRVASFQIYQQLANQLSISEIVEAQGLKPGTKVTQAQMIRSTPEVAEKLMISPGEMVYKVCRVHTADNLVISFNRSYLRKEYQVTVEQLETTLSLYRCLTEIYGKTIIFTDDTIWAEPASKSEAELLEIRSGEAILKMDRLGYDSDNQVIEYSNAFVRSDRLKYKIRMFRKGKIQ